MTKVKAHPASTVKGDSIPAADVKVMETRQSLVDWVNALEARGITLRVRRNRLNAGADQQLLSAGERAFINKHRAALKTIILDPQRGQSTSTAAPVAEPEPEPVMWTHDYERRITAADVQAADVPPGTPRDKAYERARDWLEEQAQARATAQVRVAMRTARDNGTSLRSFWEEVS